MKTALVDCSDHQDNELLVVEGPSAANAIVSLRDRCTQAVIAMQGKIPNAVKTSQQKLEQHIQVADLLQSLHPERRVACQLEQYRYQRVVLINDPDVDGMHAGALLILFFHRYLPGLVEQGRLYIAPVPLYGVYRDGECLAQAYSEKEVRAQREECQAGGGVCDVRRFKSVASVDREILLHCIADNNVMRRQLSVTECERLCLPFSK